MGLIAKFKDLWNKYGMLFVGTYLIIFFISFSSLYLALDYNIIPLASIGINPETIMEKFVNIFSKFYSSESLSNSLKNNPKLATAALAYGLNKFTEPLRFGLTLFLVPKIAKALGRKEPTEEEKEKKKN